MAVICPECGTALGEGTDRSIYKHLGPCLNVPAGDVFNMRGQYAARKDEHGRRVVFLLDEIQAEREAARTSERAIIINGS